MNMSQGGSGSAGHPTLVGGMSMTAGHGTTNILPSWLAVIWTIVFIAIIIIHSRHLRDTHGQQRIWHSGHVLMAFGMAFMFAPSSIDHFNIPSGFWQLAFATTSLGVLAWVLNEATNRR